MHSAPAAAPLTFPPYTSNYTGGVFTLHTVVANQSSAQLVCNAQGGHLASFSSLEEQAEVEGAYLNLVSLRVCVRVQVLVGAASLQHREGSLLHAAQCDPIIIRLLSS